MWLKVFSSYRRFWRFGFEKVKMRWYAVYKDNKFLKQFSTEGKERLFKNIKLDRLKEFILIDEKDSNLNATYSVNVIDGSFKVNNRKVVFEGEFGEGLKLIYYRRVKKVLGSGGDSIIYCIGWENRQNPTVKRIMKIYPNKDISFETEN
jgi:hypothetical protein